LVVGVAVVGEQDFLAQFLQDEDFRHLRRQSDVVWCHPQPQKLSVRNLWVSYVCITLTVLKIKYCIFTVFKSITFFDALE